MPQKARIGWNEPKQPETTWSDQENTSNKWNTIEKIVLQERLYYQKLENGNLN